MNGRDVSDKEETESLFAENKKAVTLLVSRYLSIDDYFENSDEMYSDNELWNEDSDEKRLLMESMKSPSVTTPPSAVPTKETVSPKRQQSFAREKAPTPNNNGITAAPPTTTEQLSKLLYHNDPLHHTKVKAHLESVNNEIQMLDQRMEQLMMNNNNNNNTSNGLGPKGKVTAEEADEVSATSQEVYQDPVDSRPSIPRSNSMVERFSNSRIHQIVDSETEHIYETIPEYSEEPIYCSPHDSHVDLAHSHQQQQHHQHPHQSQQQRPGQSMTKTGVPLMRWSKSFSAKDKGTRQQHQHPIMPRLSSGDDNCDNTNQFSSSPFNTDSGNSNKFLTLEFCANERAQCQGSTLVLCAPARRDKRNSSGGGVEAVDRNGRRSGDKAATNVKVAKQKVKPTGNSRMPNSLSNGHFGADEKMSKSFSASSTLPASDTTMYTNAANLEQTITLQQEMFRQAMLKQKMLQHQQLMQSQRAAAAMMQQGGGGAKDQQLGGRKANGVQDTNNKEKVSGFIYSRRRD